MNVGSLSIFSRSATSSVAAPTSVPKHAAAVETSARHDPNSKDGVELSGGPVEKLQQDVAQLDRFSDRMSALSLGATVGTFLLCIVGGPATLVPALCMAGLSGLSCAVSLSSESEARTLEEKAAQLAGKSPPTTLTILD